MWTCKICGTEHEELPLCFGAEAPWREMVPPSEFEDRVELTKDQCVVDDSTFFVRGHIAIPILGSSDTLAWSVWCSLSEESFRHCTQRWHLQERVGDSYFGWLCTDIPVYKDTMNLKTNVRSREPGVVPHIEIQQCEHELYQEQCYGIDAKRLAEIVHLLLHGG